MSKIEVEDSRRLTGPNLLADGPGAVIDGRLEGVDVKDFLDAWQLRARQVLDAVGWRGESTAFRAFQGGVSVFHSAPVDALYAATEANEWAWHAACVDVRAAESAESLESAAARLRRAIDAERNPRLLALQASAHRHGVSFIPDDDHASVGTGMGSRTWPVDEIPDPTEIPWAAVQDIPRALVTGTNGKTTTVRMFAAIASAARRNVGFTCTDGIYVGGTQLDAGDWSGPGGARAVLRDTRVEMAVLETARGGMLRRGLAVDRADAVAVTNVAADHLGEWGVHSVQDVADAKLVIAKAVRHGAPLVINADDPILAQAARSLGQPVTWYAVDEAERIRDLCAGTACVWLADAGALVRLDANGETVVASVADIPATLGGAAVHNIGNALAAAALAHALGLPDAALREGLEGFHPSPEMSPGRTNLFDLGGARILVDFVHNAHGFAAIGRLVSALRPARVSVMIGHAGDRDDASIRDMADAAWQLHPQRVAIKEMTQYLRGRSLGEVPGLFRDQFASLGAGEGVVTVHAGEVEAARTLLAWAEAGDVVVLSTLAERTAVLDLVVSMQASGWTPGAPLPEKSLTSQTRLSV